MSDFLPVTATQTPRDIWVVFSNQADLTWLKILKPGFRHCFVLIHDGEHWLAIDPMSHYVDFSILPVDPAYDLPRWLTNQGLSFVKATPNRALKKPAPFAVFTCVEVIKRFLGIHRRRVITPWQLYRYLQKQT